VPKWSDFGNVWSTLRELDVNAIRDEAERSLIIGCVGHTSALEVIERLLFSGEERYGPAGFSPLELVPITQAAERAQSLTGADMLVFAIDSQITLNPAEAEAFGKLERLSIPFLVVRCGAEQADGAATLLPRSVLAHMVVIDNPSAIDAPDRLAAALLERLPTELHLAAARRLPGLRATVARDLINSTSFTNATYALASGLPSQIPILSIPFATADILVLTKNQALLVYRLALAYGAPAEFQERLREVAPVIGGAFLWRQAARSLVGLIPVWGLVPKVAIAYAGTYTTGFAAWRWYASGELVSTAQLKRVSQEAIATGRARAAELIERARANRTPKSTTKDGPSLVERIKRRLPGRRQPPEMSTPKE
jgi:uncharacterized protein (DUF697 family)